MAKTYNVRRDVMIERRNRLLLSQQELADLIGMSKSQISRIETGHNKPYKSTIRKIAKALDLNREELVDWNLSTENVEKIAESQSENEARREEIRREGKDVGTTGRTGDTST